MSLTEQIGHYLNAARWTSSVSTEQLLANSLQTIEKLEQDRRVLRWALGKAREAITGGTPFYSQTLLSIIETAESMTEPANDR